MRSPLRLLAVALPMLAATMAAPAHADSNYPSEVRSMSLVTRLTLDDGAGWLTLHPRFRSGSYAGFEVAIPAGDGQWLAAPVVAMPELGIECREDPGFDLHYRCGETEGVETGFRLPMGGYQIALKVEHTGNPDGLVGTSSIDASTGQDHVVGPMSPDLFPVHSAPHPRSSAEVAMAPLTQSGPSYEAGEATLPTTLTVVPGEHVTALDVTLPRIPWQITGTNAASLGLQCFVRTNGPSLHCRPAVGMTEFQPGRYGLTVLLRHHDHTEDQHPRLAPNSTVRLTVDGDAEASYDDFPWRFPNSY